MREKRPEMGTRDAMKSRTARLPFWRRLGWRLGASFLLLTALAVFVSHRSMVDVLIRALEVLRQEAGAQFDPRVVDAALAIPAERWQELLGPSEAPRSA